MNLKDQIEALNNELEVPIPQHPEEIINRMSELASYMAIAAELKGRGKEALERAKLGALKGCDMKQSPSIIRMIIDGKTAEEQGDYVQIDRINSFLTTQSEMCRSVLSWKKEELNHRID